MMDVKAVVPSFIAEKIKKAMDDWHKPNKGTSPLNNLSLFRQSLQRTRFNHRRVTNELLLQAIHELEEEHADSAAYLRQRYLDDLTVAEIGRMRNISDSKVYEIQKLALEWLATTLWDMECEYQHQHQSQTLSRLEPATYTKLIGREQEQEELLAQLGSPAPPYILSLTGMGGIGKTALTDSLLRKVMAQERFDEIGWITVRQSRLNLLAEIEPIQPAAHNVYSIIRQLCLQLIPDHPLPTNFDQEEAIVSLGEKLRKVLHLIVIDNLETVADTRDLLPVLHRLANPSKFLLTSREGLHREPNIYHYPISSLNKAAAIELIRHEATSSRLPLLAASSDEALYPVYKTVGGNPLALRLVVGLAHHQDLEDILSDLKSSDNPLADQLYKYLFDQAWSKLTELEHQVLLTMPTIPPEGGHLDLIAQNSGLSQQSIRFALSRLAVLNLVQVSSRASKQSYRIHELTKNFLLELVLW